MNLLARAFPHSRFTGYDVDGGYAEYLVHHERQPGIGSLMGWRGVDGSHHGKGPPNPAQLERYLPESDLPSISSAYEFSAKAHQGQQRRADAHRRGHGAFGGGRVRMCSVNTTRSARAKAQRSIA